MTVECKCGDPDLGSRQEEHNGNRANQPSLSTEQTLRVQLDFITGALLGAREHNVFTCKALNFLIENGYFN